MWLTNTIVPSYSVSDSARISADSVSRWLVGSSRSRKFPGATRIFASATRAFSPPERTPIDLSTSSPRKRKAPRMPRTCAGLIDGTTVLTSCCA
ncbi:MAG: hypothetical protein IPK07_32935 [Deltaproteobacteria bacterium]|nr:hypothetical protein [Deltaproteobacteria bacterium]